MFAAIDVMGATVVTTPSTTTDLRLSTGRLDPACIAELDAHARNGGCVLLLPQPGDELAETLAGARIAAPLPRTEWFVALRRARAEVGAARRRGARHHCALRTLDAVRSPASRSPPPRVSDSSTIRRCWCVASEPAGSSRSA